MVNLNVTYLGFAFVLISFIHIHVAAAVLQFVFKSHKIKQVDCKMSTKNVNNYK